MHYRSSWMTEELDVFRDQFRKFLAKDSVAARRKMARSEAGRSFGLARAGRDGRPAAEHPGSLWRPRASFAYEAAVIEDLEPWCRK